MESNTKPFIGMAFLGLSGFLAYQYYKYVNHSVMTLHGKRYGHYNPKILFTPAMQTTDHAGNMKYWDNRWLDPEYKLNEAIRYSPEAIKQGLGQAKLPDRYLH